MTWQRVVVLGLLVGGAVAAAAFHNDLLAATLARAAAGLAVNREPDRNGTTSSTPTTSLWPSASSNGSRWRSRAQDLGAAW